MKKFVSLALAIVLTLALSVTAFAAYDGGLKNDAATITVNGVYSEDFAAAEATYRVVLSWNEVSFTYTVAGQKTWDTTNCVEVDPTETEPTWEEGTKNITVEAANYSNRAVTISAAVTSDYIEFASAVTPLELAAAAGAAVEDDLTIGVKVKTGAGALAKEGGAIGTITLTIAAA